MTTRPTLTPEQLRLEFEQGVTLPEFIERAQVNQALWRAVHARAEVPEDLAARARALPAGLRLLAIAADWCGDAVNTLPAIAALASAAPQLELRVVDRDEHPELMDAHRTGVARAIPVVITLDERYAEIGWWAPRPTELQRWVTGPGQALGKEDRYREVRRWYARDRGRTTQTEILALLERAATAHAA